MFWTPADVISSPTSPSVTSHVPPASCRPMSTGQAFEPGTQQAWAEVPGKLGTSLAKFFGHFESQFPHPQGRRMTDATSQAHVGRQGTQVLLQPLSPRAGWRCSHPENPKEQLADEDKGFPRLAGDRQPCWRRTKVSGYEVQHREWQWAS
ncbi:hypothetical protein HJG60_009182 [Phyllostomus discolor]|uniref:Uncharacterized protein n=1 Tax=Phyllostomus discolor TaxID=89673 RepID=A0A834DFT1_9CHIR|nr:hypothetical protein HJG60_009182 [Phyllostomus discolor]